MSESATAPAPPLIADRLADFSDRLPAMLVKELRQGLRAKTFVIVFLTLQAILALVLLGSLGAARSPQSAGHFISGVIFLFFSYAVLVIQPVRGIGALHREIQGNTIELMVLTRLNAWRIVLGKWVSLVSQSALLLAAIVPYLILRYWFGDMNLFGELMLLGLVFVASAVLTAVIVGISCVPSVILRGLIPLLAAAGMIMAIPPLCFGYEFDELVDFASIPNARTFWAIAMLAVGGLYVGWTALGLGASMIAPAAENHSTPRRWIILGLLVLSSLAGLFFELPPEGLVLFVLVLVVPAVVMAITEPFALLPPVCLPFLKRGALGALAGRVLYPGWPSGVVFAFVIIGLGALALWLGADQAFEQASVNILLALLGFLLMPAACLALLGERVRQRFVIYLLILVAALILTLVLGFVAQAMPVRSRDFLWFFVWLPWIHAFLQIDHPPESLFFSVLAVTSGYALILLVAALLKFRDIRKIEQECRTISSPQ